MQNCFKKVWAKGDWRKTEYFLLISIIFYDIYIQSGRKIEWAKERMGERTNIYCNSIFKYDPEKRITAEELVRNYRYKARIPSNAEENKPS